MSTSVSGAIEVIGHDGVATLLSALIGFTGVSLTLFATARSRQRGEDQRETARIEALLGALTGELKSNRSMLEPYYSILEAVVADGRAIYLRRIKFGATLTTGIFDANIGNIGMLHSRAIEKVARAYSHLKMLDSFISRGLVTQTTGSPGQRSHTPVAQFDLRDPREARALHQNIKDCIEAVTDAIDALDTTLKAGASVDLTRGPARA